MNPSRRVGIGYTVPSLHAQATPSTRLEFTRVHKSNMQQLDLELVPSSQYISFIQCNIKTCLYFIYAERLRKEGLWDRIETTI